MLPFTAFGHSDTGRQRASNEDHYVCLRIGDDADGRYVVAVADGMGGHAGGQVASEIAASVLEAEVSALNKKAKAPAPGALLTRAFETANGEILRRAADDRALADMGTTMVAALLDGAHATLANVGDSRAYLARNGIIGQITVDHSWREEARQHDLPLDEISMSPFRETITRSLGVDKAVDADLYEIDLRQGDRILLSSDGVHDLLPDVEILSAVVADETTESISRRLIELANQAGGHDNCTCVLIVYEEPAAGAAVAAGGKTGVASR